MVTLAFLVVLAASLLWAAVAANRYADWREREDAKTFAWNRLARANLRAVQATTRMLRDIAEASRKAAEAQERLNVAMRAAQDAINRKAS